jgi:hypothetical protein
MTFPEKSGLLRTEVRVRIAVRLPMTSNCVLKNRLQNSKVVPWRRVRDCVLKLRRSALLRDADTMSISSAGRLSRFDMLDELVRCVDRVDSGDV